MKSVTHACGVMNNLTLRPQFPKSCKEFATTSIPSHSIVSISTSSYSSVTVGKKKTSLPCGLSIAREKRTRSETSSDSSYGFVGGMYDWLLLLRRFWRSVIMEYREKRCAEPLCSRERLDSFGHYFPCFSSPEPFCTGAYPIYEVGEERREKSHRGPPHTRWVRHNGVEQAADSPGVLGDVHSKQVDDLRSHAVLICGSNDPGAGIFVHRRRFSIPIRKPLDERTLSTHLSAVNVRPNEQRTEVSTRLSRIEMNASNPPRVKVEKDDGHMPCFPSRRRGHTSAFQEQPNFPSLEWRKEAGIRIRTRAWFAIRRDISASIEVFP